MGATMVGARVRRREDPRLLRGQGGFVDDLNLPGMLHLSVIRSPFGHARIRSIDLSGVRSAPGVVDAFAVTDAFPEPPTFPVLIPVPSLKPCPQYPLARDTVRYVGEPVAVVVATDRATAEDAAELAEIDYEPLPAVVDYDAAQEPGAAQLHDTVPDNVAARWTDETGDVDAAFAAADTVVHDRLRMQRYTGVPMETRGVLATHEPVTGELTIWSSGQWPHTQRGLTAALLGLEEQRVRVVQPDVGGGFGVKVELYPEDLLVPLAAIRTGRPVKWIEDRREHLLGIVHAREMAFDLELALRSDGTILGLRGTIVSDQGGYFRALGVINASLAITGLPGPYVIPAYRAEMICVLTNKSPCSPYRGAGGPEATFARERLFDLAAAELGMDPAELRMKNLVPPESMPYDAGLTSVEAHVVYDSGDFPAGLRQALDNAGYRDFRAAQALARAQGRMPGMGICVYVQLASVGPYESAEVRVDPAGKITVVSGAAPQGQGTGTALAQVVADQLDIPFDDINVVFADTQRIPFGVGTYASRNAVMAGSAAMRAAEKVRAKALDLAAHLLEVDHNDLEWVDGAARVTGVPEKSLTIGQLAAAATPGGSRPDGMDPGLEARHYYEQHEAPFSFGVHLCEVEVEPETGQVEVKRYVVVNDCGRMINPMIVEGQITGGVAQGLGGALLEELVYDEEGQLRTTSLLDYQLPSSLDLPSLEISHVESVSPLNPLGVKGIGEGGAIAGHTAVANAVADAIAHTGGRVTTTPLRPALVWKLMNGKAE
jgi:aerobic carbon-monoxide dehydrogenase large subunit